MSGLQLKHSLTPSPLLVTSPDKSQASLPCPTLSSDLVTMESFLPFVKAPLLVSSRKSKINLKMKFLL